MMKTPLDLTYFFTADRSLIIQAAIGNIMEWQVAFRNGLRSTVYGTLDDSDERALQRFYDEGDLGSLSAII